MVQHRALQKKKRVDQRNKAKAQVAKAKDDAREKEVALILGFQAKANADAISAQAVIMIKQEALTVSMPHTCVGPDTSSTSLVSFASARSPLRPRSAALSVEPSHVV
jgi:hypothetical protein